MPSAALPAGGQVRHQGPLPGDAVQSRRRLDRPARFDAGVGEVIGEPHRREVPRSDGSGTEASRSTSALARSSSTSPAAAPESALRASSVRPIERPALAALLRPDGRWSSTARPTTRQRGPQGHRVQLQPRARASPSKKRQNSQGSGYSRHDGWHDGREDGRRDDGRRRRHERRRGDRSRPCHSPRAQQAESTERPPPWRWGFSLRPASGPMGAIAVRNIRQGIRKRSGRDRLSVGLRMESRHIQPSRAASTARPGPKPSATQGRGARAVPQPMEDEGDGRRRHVAVLGQHAEGGRERRPIEPRGLAEDREDPGSARMDRPRADRLDRAGRAAPARPTARAAHGGR